MLFVFENGKAAKIEMKSYDTKSNRRRLTGAYSDKSGLVAAFHLREEAEVVLYSTAGRALVLASASVAPKTTRSSQGVAVMTLKKNQSVMRAEALEAAELSNPARYRTRTLPAAGAILKDTDGPEKQLEL